MYDRLMQSAWKWIWLVSFFSAAGCGKQAAPVAHKDKAPELVELLHSVPSAVAVSSVVPGSSAIATNLFDGNLETVWSSYTGDLQGAWIDFQLPPTVQVQSIKLAAGDLRTMRTGDLFVKNHRIRKVRLLRNEKVLGDFTLDVEKRELQALSVDSAGGDFRILVLETLPGTEPQQRHLFVSELQVWGRLPAGLKPSLKEPTLKKAGSLDKPPPLPHKGRLAINPMLGPFATLDDYAKVADGKVRVWPGAGEPQTHGARAAPYLAVNFIDVGGYSRPVIQTAAGWFVCEDNLHGNPDELRLEQVRPGAPQVVMAGGEINSTGEPGTHCSKELIICGIGPSRHPSCTDRLLLGGADLQCRDAGETSAWDWLIEPSFLPGEEISFEINTAASEGLKPEECSSGHTGRGAGSACRQKKTTRLEQIQARLPTETEAEAKRGGFALHPLIPPLGIYTLVFP